MNWSVYIIKCRDNKLYTGITKNIEKRVKDHNAGRGCRFTKYRWPVELLYKEYCTDYSSAREREVAIKKLKRQEKIDLIKSNCQVLRQLKCLLFACIF